LAILTALKFNKPDGAHQMWTLLNQLRRQHQIAIHDAAIVSWPNFKEKPRTHRLRHLAGAGERICASTELGFDDEFVRQVRNQVIEGASALILLTGSALIKQVAHPLKGSEMGGLAGFTFPIEEESEIQALF